MRHRWKHYITSFHGRHSRGVEPTEAGEILAQGAEAILRLADTVKNEVVTRAAEPRGTVRIGLPPSLGLLLTGDLVADLAVRFPKVVRHLVEQYSAKLSDDLIGDRLDIAVTSDPEPNPLLLRDPLVDEEIWLLMPPKCSLTRNPSVTLSTLAGLPLIQPGRANKMRDALERHFAARNLDLRIVVEVDAFPVITDLVRRGIGYHVSPYSAVMPCIREGMSGCQVKGLSMRRVLQRRFDRPVTSAIKEAVSAIHRLLEKAAAQHAPAIRRVQLRGRRQTAR